MLEYEGYLGAVRFRIEDRVFFGKVEYIRSLITFEGTAVASLESAFVEAVADYLETCRELGRTREKPVE